MLPLSDLGSPKRLCAGLSADGTPNAIECDITTQPEPPAEREANVSGYGGCGPHAAGCEAN